MANTRDIIGEQATLDGLINMTLTSLEENGITQPADYALAENKALTSVVFPAVTNTGQYMLKGCTELVSISLPAATTIGQYCFQGCNKGFTLNAPVVETIGMYAFFDVRNFAGWEVPVTVSQLKTNTFAGCYGLTWLKLPRTSMVEIEPYAFISYVFDNTLIIRGLGVIYVPSNLVATYKADSKWSELVIASIDDYPITDYSTISDSWSTILANEANGTYSTVYHVGDTKKLTINGNDVYMQIAAFDADSLTGGGTAKITWVARHVTGKHRMNATNTNADGWAATEMRTWLTDTVLPTIDSTVRSAIKSVDKTYYDKTSNSTKTVSDTLWIPSWREVGFSTSDVCCESSGPIYSLLASSSSRTKYNTIDNTTGSWVLRSAAPDNYFCGVAINGSQSKYSRPNDTLGVVFGFCT